MPRVAFDEAIEDLLEREPRLAADWEEVSAVYSREHAFALARSADQELTEAIQRAMGRLVRSGAPVEVGETVIRAEAVKREVLGFTRAYAETVYRTNVATAFSAGRWRALADPEVQIIIPALEYHATLDSSVRENHRAAHGLIMAVDDDRWSQFSPPMGYNCRCAAVPVDRDRLRRMRRLTPEGLVVRQRTPDGAHPDPGFGGGRPDRVIYGFTAAR